MSADIRGVIVGTATKVRVELTLTDETTVLLSTVIVKGPFGRNVESMEHPFTDEMRGYRDVVMDSGLRTPKCHSRASRR